MSFEVFTQRWAQAWADELRASSDYRRAASKWEWALVLEMEADPDSGVPDDRAVFLDLWHGDCRSARIPDELDREEASYVIRAAAQRWKQVLDGEIEPIMGLMSGRLKLTRGSLARLTPHIQSAKELLLAATRIGSHFPNEMRPTEAPSDEPPSDETPSDEPPSDEPPSDETSSEALANPPSVGETAAGSRTAFAPPSAVPAPAERVLQTTSSRGLDYDLPPMRLWQKAKRFGIWDPMGIDFSPDAEDWARLDPLESEVLLHLVSLFQAGEEAVTLDLLPLIMVIAQEGRLEEEMYLTSFLWEEAKHVELFRRFIDEVAGDTSDLAARFQGESYKRVFYDRLPSALHRLCHDASPQAQAEASVTYNMVVEGVLAETGYHAFHKILVRSKIMPGMQRGVSYLKSDEARHMAYGVYLLSRLVAEHGDPVWRVIERRMNELLPEAIGLISEMFERYEVMPFGLKLEDFTDYATRQFQHRFERIERARRQTVEEICSLPVMDETPS